MLPASYQFPAAVILLVGGIISCFFGYRLFRTVLAIFGFILGALAASSLFGVSDTGLMLVAAVVGGLVGAFVLIAAYFVGVALVGAGLGAVIANLVFSAGDRDPSVFMVILFSVAGAVGATYLQRYFIIVGTAFGGAWTMIVGAMALVGDRTALKAATSGDVWVAYPLNPAPGQQWVLAVWIVLSLIGAGVQLGITGGEKGRVVKRRKKKR
jgi:Domain of unknown function (DUF4203)